MMDLFELREMIRSIVNRELTYYRHYTGKVLSNVDPEKKGRVFITIEELDRTSFESAIQASPRQGRSLIIPDVNEYVEIYFMNGDETRPVYLYPMSEWSPSPSIKSSKGIPIEDTLYESNKLPTDNITFNKVSRQLKFLSGTEPMVKGTQLLLELTKLVALLQTLKTGLAWTPVAMDGGAALKAALTSSGFYTSSIPTFESILSLFIFGK